VLFVDASLSYLTEILDSAQEGFPFLYVNGEKYMFSQDVLEAGQKLFHGFCEIQHVIKNIYSLAWEENPHASVEEIKEDIKANLEAFDKYWVTFEQLYVFELMLIEADARRYITNAVEIEKDLIAMELKEKTKGKIFLDSEEYNNARKKLVKVIGQINSVANPEGTGRDDLGVEILIRSEHLIRTVSATQSKAVRCLAEKIKKTFKDLRALFKKYQQNIEVVDPQLRNNPDLVDALFSYENSWEKGAAYFTESKKWQQLLHFSQRIEALKEKHDKFANQIEDRDAEIFVSIPCILVLMAINNEDKGLWCTFWPEIFQDTTELNKVLMELKELLGGKMIAEDYELYNYIEKIILDMDLPDTLKEKVKDQELKIELILQKIKWLSMQVSRNDPQEWNLFLDVLLIS
jgi:tetratricopeptide (TPR) repeat protein